MIISGIEPVDELMGGLERGALYLVHGEASGTSLFGIKFLIEGLKRNENSALVTRYSPEEAVRRFARLGYDCLEDVYSGRLVILEYSDDIIQKIGTLRELTPVLRELEWLLGETRPERLIFDPVTSVLAGAEGDLETRAREFSEWARSFGATVVLVANDVNREVVQTFEPLVAESFRFDVRETGDRSARFIAFEKSLTIPDHEVEVDPSRGVFLLGRPQAPGFPDIPHPPSVAELESIREELRSIRDRIHEEEPLGDIDLVGETSSQTDREADKAEPVSESERRDTLQTSELTPVPQPRLVPEPADSAPTEELELTFEEHLAPSLPAIIAEGPLDELSDLLDDLSGTPAPFDLDLPELESAVSQPEERAGIAATSAEQASLTSREPEPAADRDTRDATDAEAAKSGPQRHGRAADLKIDSAMARRAVDLLLSPPEAHDESEIEPPQPEAERPGPLDAAEAQAKDFNVLIIEDDAQTCDALIQTLSEYTLEVVHDGMSGLAKLLAFKPDVVVLGFDLPIFDGFKILRLVRSGLNVPIIIVSGSRMRAIDRVMASELGADYFITKPFSAKELKYKARQLIARYRGINSWIINPPRRSHARSSARGSQPAASVASEPEPFTPYNEFEAEVEKRVRESKEGDPPFSVLGCGLRGMTASRGKLALRLFEIVHGLKREMDVTSTNLRNEMVVLLQDADTRGARAFAGRLRLRVVEELNLEPALWVRSFPDREMSTGAIPPTPQHGSTPHRRSSDTAPE